MSSLSQCWSWGAVLQTIQGSVGTECRPRDLCSIDDAPYLAKLTEGRHSGSILIVVPVLMLLCFHTNLIKHDTCLFYGFTCVSLTDTHMNLCQRRIVKNEVVIFKWVTVLHFIHKQQVTVKETTTPSWLIVFPSLVRQG